MKKGANYFRLEQTNEGLRFKDVPKEKEIKLIDSLGIHIRNS